MTYTTGDAFGRRNILGKMPQRTPQVNPGAALKQSHLNRNAPAMRPEREAPAAPRRRYGIEVLMDDGSIQSQEHFAPADFYLEDICACFGRGTLIGTTQGQVAVEDLRPGDRLKTRDNGDMTLRWIGSCAFGGPHTTTEATGYPIRIKADALGDLRPVQDLIVSPRFRVLSNHPSCAALFGSSETLAPAVDLMDGDTVLEVRPPEDLMFYNLMFDSHQIIQANGLDTESYHPGNFGVSVMTLEMQHHLRQIFPHLDGDLARFGRTIRPILKGFEAEVLRVG
jgi:hypothetical protein